MNCSHCQSNPAQFRCGECTFVYCSKACAHQDWIGSHALICGGGEKRERNEDEEEAEIQLIFMNETEPRSFFVKPSRFWTIYELIQDAGLKSPIPIPNMDMKTFLTLLYREESRIKTADMLVRVFAAANYLDGDSDFNQLGQMVAERLKRDDPNPILTQLPRDLYRNFIFPNFDLSELKNLSAKYPVLKELVDEEILKRAKEMFPLLDNPVEAYEYLGGKTNEINKSNAMYKYPLVNQDFQQLPNLGKRADRQIFYNEAVVLQYLIRKYGGTLKGLFERIRIKEERSAQQWEREQRKEKILKFFKTKGIVAESYGFLKTFLLQVYSTENSFFADQIEKIAKGGLEFDPEWLDRYIFQVLVDPQYRGTIRIRDYNRVGITFTPEFRARYPHLF